jgi:hypothetical protein
MRKGFISEEIDRQNGIACEGLTADQSRAMLKIISQIGERYSLSVLIKKYVNDVDKFKQELDVMLTLEFAVMLMFGPTSSMIESLLACSIVILASALIVMCESFKKISIPFSGV